MLSEKVSRQVWVRKWTGGAVKQSLARVHKTVQILYLRYKLHTPLLSGTRLSLTASLPSGVLFLVLSLGAILSAWLNYLDAVGFLELVIQTIELDSSVPVLETRHFGCSTGV
jgi:hypothetical protein